MSHKKGGLSTTMESVPAVSERPSSVGAETSGYHAPFNKPHSTGKDTIPVVFVQDLPKSTPAEISTPMHGPERTATRTRESGLGKASE